MSCNEPSDGYGNEDNKMWKAGEVIQGEQVYPKQQMHAEGDEVSVWVDEGRGEEKKEGFIVHKAKPNGADGDYEYQLKTKNAKEGDLFKGGRWFPNSKIIAED